MEQNTDKKINPRVKTVVVIAVAIVIFVAGFIVANLVFDKFVLIAKMYYVCRS